METRVARVGTDPIWGYTHCLRVYVLARELGVAEDLRFDAELLYIAALLHDIGLYKPYAHRKEPDHARRSAAVAGQFSRDAGFPAQETEIILDAIEHHPPDAPAGSSAEAVLLKDAVALDYLGAVGVSRVISMVGPDHGIPDLAAAVQNIRSLHESLPKLLILESSRNLARGRIAETEHFTEALTNATANLKLL